MIGNSDNSVDGEAALRLVLTAIVGMSDHLSPVGAHMFRNGELRVTVMYQYLVTKTGIPRGDISPIMQELQRRGHLVADIHRNPNHCAEVELRISKRLLDAILQADDESIANCLEAAA